MKRFIILPLVIALGVFVSFDGLRAVGPLALQEDAGEETSRAEAIRAHFDKLVSEDKDVKREALLYFGKVDKTFEAEVPLFTAALKDKRYQVRAISAYALGKIGGAAVGSIPDVEELLSDSSASVQKYAKRALERLRTLKPDPKKLTAKEAADALAFWIGKWESEGIGARPGETSVRQVGSTKGRWKEKGKSIQGMGTSKIGDEPEVKFLEELEYDQGRGIFIWRSKHGDQQEKVIHRRYDPATRTYHDKWVSPELPRGITVKGSTRITGPDSATWSVEFFNQGKLDFSAKGEMKRVREDSGSEPLERKRNKRIIILANGPSPFWGAVKIGAQEAAADFNTAEAGLRVVFDTSNFSDRGQIGKLRSYQGMSDVAGLGISIINSGNPGIAKELRKLARQGVKIVTIDLDIDRKKDRDSRIAYIGTDNVYGGEELGKAAKGLKPDGGNYATFVGLKGAVNAIERIGGFGVGAGDKFKQKENFGDGGDLRKARKNVRDAIDRNADLDTLVGIWAYNAPAIVDIVKQLKRRKDFTIVTFDAEPIAIHHMKNGMIDAMAVQNPHAMGYEGVRMLKALITDDKDALAAMEKRMNRTEEKDLFDTGLKIIIPDEGSPLAETKFGDNTNKLTLSKFTEWLKSKGLQGS